MKRTLPLLLALLGTFLIGPVNAFAQATQTVSIENGTVVVNGKMIASDKLPESLQSIKDGNLIQADKDALANGNIAVYFSSDGSEMPIRIYEKKKANQMYVISPVDESKPMENYVASLHQRAAEFNSIRHKIDAIREPEAAELALELKIGAENVARIAESFPRVQFEAYLDDIQDNDRFLYKELMREQEMELETHRLAMQIREASSRSDQERIATQLREALNEIFQLKQENRKTEIKQLSSKLEDMQKRLKEREKLREDIVENRLRELLDQYRW